jgi:uncharacterized protein (DUF983 family)
MQEEMQPVRDNQKAIIDGVLCRCPKCHEGKMFKSYLKATPSCNVCGEDLTHHNADDEPPYLVIFLVGHIVVPLVLMVETRYSPAMWVQMAIWPLVSIVLALLTLSPLKGVIIAIQWAKYMGGFAEQKQKSH